MSNNTVPTTIVDKNGKVTTVHKKVDGETANTRAVGASTPSPSPAVPVIIKYSGQGALEAVKALPDDSAIFQTRIESWEDTLRPIEGDDEEDINPNWEADSIEYGKSELWGDTLSLIENKMGTHGLAAQYADEAAAFIIAHQDEIFDSNNSILDAMDEFLFGN